MSIAVEGVGKFGARTEVIGLGPGLNILAAPNEAGKSTLFRAVRACVFERHNTRIEEVRNLATEGLSLPVTVVVGFELGGKSYQIEKSFLKGAAARLTRDQVVIARGREADEMVWELLGIRPGAGRSIDEAAYGLLWVDQGESFHAPKPSDAAASTLNAVIHAEVGSLIGGERARAILSEIRDQLGDLVTDTGRPKSGGQLAAAVNRLNSVEVDLAEAERRLSILDSQIVDLTAKRGERDRAADPALLHQMTASLEEATQELKSGEAQKARLGALQSDEALARSVADRKAADIEELEQRAARIDADRKREGELRDQLGPLVQRTADARRAIQNARAELEKIDAASEQGEQEERQLLRVEAASTRLARKAELAARQAALSGIADRLVANTAALLGNAATESLVASLDAVERDLAVLGARLEAAAPQVGVTLGAHGAGQVLVDEVALRVDIVRPAVEPVTIRVADMATITVSPPDVASPADRKKRQRLQEQLAKILEEGGAATAADLRTGRARRQQLEAEARVIQAELLGLGVTEESPATALEEIETEIRAIDELVQGVLTDAQIDCLPSAMEIAELRSGFRENREEARRRRSVLEGEVDAKKEIIEQAADERGRLDGMLIELSGRLKGDLLLLRDEDRDRLLSETESALEAARREHGTKAAALEEQRRTSPSQEQLDRLKLRKDRFADALENQRARLGTLDRQIANLEGQIESAGGDGLGEKVEALREERAIAERDADRQRAHIAALRLLEATIEACYEDHRERLNAPLRRHLQPYLNDVFPKADVEMGDDFQIAGLRRGAPSSEVFGQLSAGTQEQIAVLVRLAMGTMISEQGEAVPIILDDALAFSDDARIEQMFDALHRASQRQQVVILTCRERTFAALGGNQLSLR